MRRFVTSTLFLIAQTCIAATDPPVTANNSMIVTAQHLATKVGIETLNAGGNAIDAAVAIGYTEAVTHPCCGNIGGGGFMLIRFADGRTTFFNFREKAPNAAKPDVFKNDKEWVHLHAGHHHGRLIHAYMSVGVPGTVMGLNTALKKYGTMSLKQVLTPAIHLAEDGFTLTTPDVKIFGYVTEDFKEEKNIADIFLKSNKPYTAGELFVQKNLANTLKAISNQGEYAFYNGSISDRIVKESQTHHGLLTKKDFQNYTIRELTPIKCNYRGYTIITAPPPSGGGVALCEMLNITDGYPLKEYGYRSAKATHFTIEAMRFAFADTNSALGDPDFVKNPVEKLISKKYATDIRNKIKATIATPSLTIGTIKPTPETENTTGYVVVDKFGNCVAVTYTLNDYFGSRIMASDTGFFLNNQLADFTLEVGKPSAFGLIKGKANLIAPGKRPLSSMAPTIITKDNKLVMALSTPGGSTIPTQLLLSIQNVIDFDMNIQEAIDAPRFHMQWLPDLTYMEPYTFSPDTLKILLDMGYSFQQSSPYGSKFWGAVAVILIDQETRLLNGAMDVRRPAGLAMGN